MLDTMTNTIDRLIDRSTADDSKKRDYRVEAAELFFDEAFNLIVDAAELPYDDYMARRAFGSEERSKHSLSVTENALNQLYDKLGRIHFGRGSTKRLPSDYLAAFPREQHAQIMNWTLERAQRSKWMVRTYETSARAVLDAYYPRVWNSEILRQVRRLILEKSENERSELIRPYLSPDHLDLKIWFPDSGTEVKKIGALIRNDETGRGRFELIPMIQVTTCTNSIIVNRTKDGYEGGFSITHYAGASAEALMIQFYAQLPRCLNASARLINRMIEAEGEALPNFRTILDGLAVEHGWKRPMLEKIDEGAEGHRTVAGLVEGITYAAHAYHEITDGERVEVEMIGGNLLYAKPKEFERLARQGEAGKRVR